jgi:hypothetical protein
MSRILISYRRADSAAYAGRLYDHLLARLGRENVFMDIATIKPGEDFYSVIERSVASCDALVAVIGKGWLTSADGRTRRLDLPDDFVRMEIAIALARNVTVIPALVGGARMPTADELPDDLSALSRRQAIEISDTRFREDVDRLVEAFSDTGADKAAEEQGPDKDAHRRRLWRFLAPTIALAILAAAYVMLLRGKALEVRENHVEGRPIAARADVPAPVTTVPLGEHGTIEHPRVLNVGVTYRLMLDKNGEAFLKPVSAVRDLTIVLDTSLADGSSSNLINRVSVLDQNGAAINARALELNQIDTGFRNVGSFSFSRPTSVAIKLSNQSGTSNHWLTVFDTPYARFVPFFGERVPQPMAIARPVSGALDTNEDVYYALALQKGEYAVSLDLTHRNGANTNITGYLALLDADGGNQRRLADVNEIGASRQVVSSVSMKRDDTVILRIKNWQAAFNYTVRVAAK